MHPTRKLILAVHANGEQTLEVLLYTRLLVSSTTASTSANLFALPSRSCPGMELNHRRGALQAPALPLSYQGKNNRFRCTYAKALLGTHGWVPIFCSFSINRRIEHPDFRYAFTHVCSLLGRYQDGSASDRARTCDFHLVRVTL